MRYSSLIALRNWSTRLATAIVAVFVLGIAYIGFVFLSSRGRSVFPDPLSAALAQNQRNITPRICGLTYGLPSRSDDLVLIAAANELLARDHDTRHRAVAMLILGRVAEARRNLEAGVPSARRDARYWSDLAAARYEDARANDDPWSFASALAAADRAIELDPDIEEAFFNRAVILEALGLLPHAAVAYGRYLVIDVSSTWATKARAGLRRVRITTALRKWEEATPVLERAVREVDTAEVDDVVRDFPQQARTWAEGEFLTRWAESWLAGQEEAAEHWLAVSRSIGLSLERLSDEGLLADAVKRIDRSTSRERRTLAQAQVAYRRGRILYSQRKVAEAIPLLTSAHRQFAAEGSPMALAAAYFRANAAFDSHDLELAERLVDATQSRASPRYRALSAQLRSMKATLQGSNGRTYEALASARDALSAFERLNERPNAARLRGMCASLLAVLGQDSEAWRLRPVIFRESVESGNAALMELALNGAARDELADQHWDVARSLLRLETQRAAVSPRLRFDALMWTAFAESKLSGKSPAFDAAKAAAKQISDRHLQDDAHDELQFAEAVNGNCDLNRAVRLLTDVINYRTRHVRLTLIAPAYVERARALRKLGRDAEAEVDLENAITTIERSGKEISESSLRDTYFGEVHDAYDELVDLLTARGDYAQAFESADRGRARVIADMQSGASSTRHRFSLDALRARIGPNDVVVHYTSLASRLLVLTIDINGWTAEVRAIARPELIAVRDRLLRAIEHDDPHAIADSGRRLHDMLIGRLRDHLSPRKTLVIIPDNVIASVPFGPLLGSDGKFLIERTAIVIAPSGAAYSNGSLGDFESGKDTVIITDPAFDKRLFPKLPRLKGARDEGLALKKLFPRANLISGDTATRNAVTDAIRHAAFVHIGAHAVSDDRDASRSFLALAPDGTDHGVWYAPEIASLPLHNTRLVVLAACRTAAAGQGRGSIRSIALSFLAAGARSVIAMAWDVEDESSRDLSVGFFKRLLAGNAPAAALRATQLEAILHGRPVSQWAAPQFYVTVDMR